MRFPQLNKYLWNIASLTHKNSNESHDVNNLPLALHYGFPCLELI